MAWLKCNEGTNSTLIEEWELPTTSRTGWRNTYLKLDCSNNGLLTIDDFTFEGDGDCSISGYDYDDQYVGYVTDHLKNESSGFSANIAEYKTLRFDFGCSSVSVTNKIFGIALS